MSIFRINGRRAATLVNEPTDVQIGEFKFKAITCGEEGRGRKLGFVNCDDFLPEFQIPIKTKSGKGYRLVKSNEYRGDVLVIEPDYGFRGWAKFDIIIQKGNIEELATGVIAQGDAGRMAQAEHKIVFANFGSSFLIRFTFGGRLYSAPNEEWGFFDKGVYTHYGTDKTIEMWDPQAVDAYVKYFDLESGISVNRAIGGGIVEYGDVETVFDLITKALEASKSNEVTLNFKYSGMDWGTPSNLAKKLATLGADVKRLKFVNLSESALIQVKDMQKETEGMLRENGVNGLTFRFV